MPDMLRPPERDRLIAFLERNLVRHLPIGGTEVTALRESTAAGPTAGWCWTADAAAAAELLALPALRPRWAALGDGLTGFLLIMGEGPVLHARAAPPACVVDSIDPRDFRVLTGAHEFTGDLSRGLVRQEARLPGGREVLHTANLVEFRIGRRPYCLDVEDTVASFGLVPQPDGVLLFHESLLSAPVGLLRRVRPVATLRYEYTIRAGDPRMRIRVALTAAKGVGLRELRLTTALDEMSGGPLARPVRRVVLGAGGQYRVPPLEGEGLITLHQGPADTLSLIEDAPPGLAAGLHIQMLSPSHLLSTKLSFKAPDGGDARPHWMLSRYMRPALAGGQTFAIEEERLMTPGTLAGAEHAYAALLRDPAPLLARDPGATADHGVALNAVAAQILFASTGAYGEDGLSAARLAELRGWYGRHVAAFFTALADAPPPAAPRPGRVPVRSLSFALMSLDLMLRAPGEAGSPDGAPGHAALLALGLDALLARQLPAADGGAFAEAGGHAHLDGHAAAMLALARMAMRRPEERISAALRRGLAALSIGPGAPNAEGRRQDVPLVRTRLPDGAWVEDDGVWSFKAGLLMRATNMLIQAAQAGAVALEEAEREHLQTLFDTCFRLLRGRVRVIDGDLEVLTGPNATEGNAATQPVVLLALLSPDEAVLGLGAAQMA
jgi:hypothetical protein